MLLIHTTLAKCDSQDLIKIETQIVSYDRLSKIVIV